MLSLSPPLLAVGVIYHSYVFALIFYRIDNLTAFKVKKSQGNNRNDTRSVAERVAPPFGEAENCTHLQLCCFFIISPPAFIPSSPLFIFSSWLSSSHPCALSLFLSHFHLIFLLLHGTVLL